MRRGAPFLKDKFIQPIIPSTAPPTTVPLLSPFLVSQPFPPTHVHIYMPSYYYGYHMMGWIGPLIKSIRPPPCPKRG